MFNRNTVRVPLADWSQLVTSVATSVGEARALGEANKAMQATIDWMRVRISQLEMERAQMLYNYTGVKVATPSIEVVPQMSTREMLASVPNFDDVGDVRALKLGVGWNEHGELKAE